MQTLQTISCEEIMSTPIAPIPFSVENLLGQGLVSSCRCAEGRQVVVSSRHLSVSCEG